MTTPALRLFRLFFAVMVHVFHERVFVLFVAALLLNPIMPHTRIVGAAYTPHCRCNIAERVSPRMGSYMGGCAIHRKMSVRQLLVKHRKMPMGVILLESMNGIHGSPCVRARELRPLIANMDVLLTFPLKVLPEVMYVDVTDALAAFPHAATAQLLRHHCFHKGLHIYAQHTTTPTYKLSSSRSIGIDMFSERCAEVLFLGQQPHSCRMVSVALSASH